MESGVSSLALRKKDFNSHALYSAPSRPTKVSPQAGIKESLPWIVPPLSCGRRNPVTKWSPHRLIIGVPCASPTLYLPLLLSQTLKQTCFLEEAFLAFSLLHNPHSSCALSHPALPGMCHGPKTSHQVFTSPFVLHPWNSSVLHILPPLQLSSTGTCWEMSSNQHPPKKTPDLWNLLISML